MTPTEKIVERIIQIANATDHSKAGSHVELYSAVAQLCELGVSARLTGLASVHRIEDMRARMGVAASLVAKEPGLREGIYREALDQLSRSIREDDVFLMSELLHIFDDHVPRGLLRSALIRAWKHSSGVLRENLSYDLRRRGNSLFLMWWLSRFWSTHIVGSTLGIVAALLGYAATPDPRGVMEMTFSEALGTEDWIGLGKAVAPIIGLAVLGYGLGAWIYGRTCK